MKVSARKQEQAALALYEKKAAQLRDYLKINGLRVTEERLLLLKQICRYEGGFTAELLLNDVESVMRISMATIYNTLDLFYSSHIIHKLNQPHKGRSVEYQLLSGNVHTMRFICTRCGRVVDFQDRAVRNILEAKRFSNFVMSDFSLSVYGLCKICRRLLQ